jgi:hypothetical protein
MFFLPESPRWLMTRDRHDQAITSLAALRGHHRDDDEIKLEASVISDSIRASGHVGGNTPFRALFTGGKTQHFRRMMLGVSSQFFQQVRFSPTPQGDVRYCANLNNRWAVVTL